MAAPLLPASPAALRRCRAAAALALALVPLATRADYKADIGYTRLQMELGAALPTGSGEDATQVEAPELGGRYLPDPSSPEYLGKTITQQSGAGGGFSGHASAVASIQYGLNASVAPGINSIDVYETSDWLGSGFLRRGSVLAPQTESRSIQNHSWIGSFDSGGTSDAEVLRRFDFMLQRDGVFAAVGLNNGNGSAIPVLLASSYHAISVGLTNGGHSSGTTTADGADRVKPEIVAPFDQTSFATPSVSAAGALLLQKARSAGQTNALRPMTVKALLLAGATKSQFPGWARTTTRPLDAHFGAGQLNIFHSYRALVAGEFSSSNSATLPPRGWDYSTTTAGTKRYFFDLAPGDTASGFSAVVTWHRAIGTTWPLPTSTLPDLSLRLYAASGFAVGALVDASLSPVDNVEHIFRPTIPAGRYALEVTANQSGVGFTLAWYTVADADQPIGAWRAMHFTAQELSNPAISGDLADPEHDGVENVLEYALALHPRTPDVSNLPVAAREPDGRVSLTFSRNTSAPDVTLAAEVSTDLVAWNAVPVTTIANPALAAAATETLKAISPLPPSTPQQFLRLKVTR